MSPKTKKSSTTDSTIYQSIIMVNDLMTRFVKTFYLSRYAWPSNPNVIVIIPKTDKELEKKIAELEKIWKNTKTDPERIEWLRNNDNYGKHCVFDRPVSHNGVKYFDKDSHEGIICRKNIAGEKLFFKNSGGVFTVSSSALDIENKCEEFEVYARCYHGLFIIRGDIPEVKPVKITAEKALCKLVNGRGCRRGAAKFLVNSNADDITDDFVYSAVKYALTHSDETMTVDANTTYDEDIDTLNEQIDEARDMMIPNINQNLIMTGGKIVSALKTAKKKKNAKKTKIGKINRDTDPALVNMLTDITSALIKDGIPTERALVLARKYADDESDELEESIVENAISLQGLVTPTLTHYVKIKPKSRPKSTKEKSKPQDDDKLQMFGKITGGAFKDSDSDDEEMGALFFK